MGRIANSKTVEETELTQDSKKEIVPSAPAVTSFDEDESELPFIDKRSVTISSVHNSSAYRNANMKVLGQKKEVIGSSIRSSQILSANKGEVEAYFPNLIGISPSNPEFVARVKAWLNNIQFVVNDSNVTFNNSFIYDKKKYYDAIHADEEKINDAFEKVDRSNIIALKDALKKKIEALNTLESTKYKYGHPENLEEYLMYRHCLLYNDVAKDSAVIHSDPKIRFYIKDEAKEAERQKKLIEQKVRAMRNYATLKDNDLKHNAMYVSICVYNNVALSEALMKSPTEQADIIINFLNSNPDKFNKFYNDKSLELKSLIETLIARGELIKSDFNQQISLPDGTFIGANMIETVAWFENPNNADIRTALENKLKML